MLVKPNEFCFKLLAGGIKPCGVVLALWYWVQSHCNLDTGKVRRCVLVVSYRCADALCICIVDWVVHISFDGLHSLTLILTRGRGMGVRMYRVSRDWESVNYVMIKC